MTFTGLIGRICLFPLQLIIRTCVVLKIHPNTLTFIGVLSTGQTVADNCAVRAALPELSSASS